MVLLAITLFPGATFAEIVVSTIISNGRVIEGPTDRVIVVRDGEKIEVTPGLVLADGDELTTLAAARVVLMRGPEVVEVYVGENTEIRIGSVFLRLGEIYVRVKRKLKEAFEVESDYGVAGVEGTEFVLRIDDGPNVATPFTCLTFEGRVSLTQVEDNKEPVFVAAGQQFTLNADRQPLLQTLSREELDRSARQFAPLIEIHRRQTKDVQVPVVIGTYLQDAATLLKDARLSIGQIEYVLSQPGIESDIVVDQDPGPGETLPPFDPVSLVVEGTPTTVPELVGQNQDEAQDVLKQANLVLGEIRQVNGSDGPEGKILGQSIDAGERVPEGTTVDIDVSAGSVRPMPPVLDIN